MYQIQEAAIISGVSVRTLHYYDSIGLLSPEKTENGYRVYSAEDMDKLQRILFYKYLGFPLKTVKNLVGQNGGSQVSVLEEQYDLLKQEASRIQQLLKTLQKTIQNAKGERTMTINEKFQGFRPEDNQAYRQEAVDTYGEEVIAESERRQKGHEEEMAQNTNDIFFGFAENLKRGVPASALENIALAKELHETIRKYSFDCSLEVFGSIGKGYVADNRFMENIDKFGPGTAQYASEAIAAYVAEGK